MKGMGFTFSKERSCPACGAKFSEAELRPEYDPVVVVICPSCGIQLWRPGSDEDAELVIHDPDADAGGI